MDWKSTAQEMMDEGYIKYRIDWEKGPAPEEDFDDLIAVRNELFEKRLIGIYEAEGIGYGNVSQRLSGGNQFVVSGTQTGGIPVLDATHFTRVTDWDLKANTLSCIGPLKASSESLTHAAVYACDPKINSILHIHNETMWRRLMDHFPTTSEDVPYGTPEMAMEVFRLYAETDLKAKGVFVMKGHFEGVFAFGNSLDEARTRLLAQYF